VTAGVKAHKLQVKVFVDGPRPELEAFIAVFHDWIKQHRIPELLIDVASYAHVPKGPGIALIGHEGDYYVDEAEGRVGLLYSRKRDAPAPEERLPDVFRRALTAAALLEKESALNGLRFRTDELLFRINDRLLAPASEATFAEVRPALDELCTKLFPGGHKLALSGTPRQLFSVRITTETKADLATLLARL
jgi:hypothetical protein